MKRVLKGEDPAQVLAKGKERDDKDKKSRYHTHAQMHTLWEIVYNLESWLGLSPLCTVGSLRATTSVFTVYSGPSLI